MRADRRLLAVGTLAREHYYVFREQARDLGYSWPEALGFRRRASLAVRARWRYHPGCAGRQAYRSALRTRHCHRKHCHQGIDLLTKEEASQIPSLLLLFWWPGLVGP